LGGASNIAGQQAGLATALQGQGATGLGGTTSYLQNAGQNLQSQGAGGVGDIASQQANLASLFQGQGAGGVGSTAAYQQGLGQNLSGSGASQLAQLFSPQFKQEQIQASMQPAREEIRNQLAGQNAMYGGAGGMGSARQALADRNLSQLGEQRLGTVAAQTAANVEAQRQQAANTMLGTGQGAIGQAGNLYQGLLGSGQAGANLAGNLYGNLLGAGGSALGQAQSGYGQMLGTGQAGANTAAGIYGNIMNAGMGASGQAQNAYGQLLGAGQGATGQAGQLYGNLGSQGAGGLNAANQAAAARIGYAQTPQDVLAKYAQVIYGTPQASTTPNFTGTQGTQSTSKGFRI